MPGIIWPIHFGDWDGQSSNTGCGIGHMVMDGLIDVKLVQNMTCPKYDLSQFDLSHGHKLID